VSDAGPQEDIMVSRAIGRCPACNKPVGLALGTRFRCRHTGCGKEFTIEQARPKPEHFGLRPETLDYFSRQVGEVGGGVALLGATLGLLLWLRAQEGLGWFLLGGCLAGAFVGLLIDKIRVWQHRWCVERNPAYPSFLRYRQAEQDYSGFRDMALQKKEEDLRRKESWWKSLTGRECERELVQHYRKRGYQVDWTGGPGDEGVDFVIRKGGRKIVVQVKAHKNQISPGVVRDLYGSLLHHRADEAWLISISGFKHSARSFAQGKPIRLMTIRQVLEGDGFAEIVCEAT
jgi:hypothetical protein